MNFVKSLSMFHVNTKEIPCLTAKGTPTEQTEGAPGVLYMDTDNGELYKCTAADYVNKVLTWKPLLERNGSPDSSQNATVATVEPAEGDIPKVFFGGPLQQTKDEAVVPFSYRSKTLSFDCYAEIKAQGNSTMNFAKKNQTVKLYKDADCTEKLKIDYKGWGKQNKFVIKAYWRDLTHTRDIVSVRLEGDCTRARPDFDNLPELLRTSPNLGGTDGFPVLVYAAGVYQGRYMWAIPKDKWMTNMDDELDEHCILCSEDYNSSCFRAPANINGNDWTDEIHDTVPASIKTRWNEVISFVMNSTDEEFVANLDNYIDVNSLSIRHLMGMLSCDFDGYGKNQLYITYNCQKWYAGRYDKDGTWGNYWTGNSMLPSNYGREQYEDMISGRPGNLLFIRFEQLFWEKLQTDWAWLKVGPLSIPNIINRFRELYDITPLHLIEEDYASTTASGAFTGIPNKTTCTIQQIQAYIVERYAWMEKYVAGLTPEIPVPCESISLDADTLSFTAEGTQVLTATVTPDGCTDKITWETSDPTIATVSDGKVTAVGNGNAIITAKCGDFSAACAIYVDGIVAWSGVDVSECLYALTEVTTFDGASYYVDTGIKLFDEPKDFTILFDADLTQASYSKASLFHCLNEATPYPGLCFNYLSSVGYCVGGYTSGNYYYSGSHYIPTGTTKVAIQVTQGIVTNIRYYNSGSVVEVELPIDCAYNQITQTLLLGCYQTTGGVKGRYWAGTINKFYVVSRAMSENEMDAFLKE